MSEFEIAKHAERRLLSCSMTMSSCVYEKNNNLMSKINKQFLAKHFFRKFFQINSIHAQTKKVHIGQNDKIFLR